MPDLRTKKPAPESGPAVGGRTYNYFRQLRTVRADSQRFSLEAQPPVHRCTGGCSEIRKGHQVLEIVGEPMEHIVVAAIICISLQRVAHFQDAAGGIVAVEVHGQRIIRPLAYLMREGRYILREHSDVI